MPPVELLIEYFEKYGYIVSEHVEHRGSLWCRLSGEQLEETIALVRANEDVCSIGIWLGPLQGVYGRRRYSLLLSLLESNYDHPLARICMYRAPDLKNETQYDPVAVLVAETSFFWDDLRKERFDIRISALIAISESASNELSARDALTNQNPFFKKLRHERSPVTRGDVSPEDVLDNKD